MPERLCCISVRAVPVSPKAQVRQNEMTGGKEAHVVFNVDHVRGVPRVQIEGDKARTLRLREHTVDFTPSGRHPIAPLYGSLWDTGNRNHGP